MNRMRRAAILVVLPVLISGCSADPPVNNSPTDGVRAVGSSVWVDNGLNGAVSAEEVQLTDPLPEAKRVSSYFKVAVEAEPTSSKKIAIPVSIHQVPDGTALEIFTSSTPDGGWTPIPAELSTRGDYALAEVPHFSFFFASLVSATGDLVQAAKSILDDYTSGAFAGAKSPDCNDETAARNQGWRADIHGKDLLWCIGLDDRGRTTLQVVNRRNYPLLVAHPGATEVSRDKHVLELASISQAISPSLTALEPGGSVTYGLATDDAQVRAQFDGAAQWAFDVQVGATSLVTVLTRGGKEASDLVPKVLESALSNTQCLAAALHPENVGILLRDCLSVETLEKAFGKKALLAAATVIAAPVLQVIRSGITATVDLVKNTDRTQLRLHRVPLIRSIDLPNYNTQAPSTDIPQVDISLAAKCDALGIDGDIRKLLPNALIISASSIANPEDIQSLNHYSSIQFCQWATPEGFASHSTQTPTVITGVSTTRETSIRFLDAIQQQLHADYSDVTIDGYNGVLLRGGNSSNVTSLEVFVPGRTINHTYTVVIGNGDADKAETDVTGLARAILRQNR